MEYINRRIEQIIFGREYSFVGEGTQAVCYKSYDENNNGIIYKIFNEIDEIENLENIKRMVGLNIEGFNFLKKFIHLNDKIIGYNTEYIKGYTLDKIPNDYEYDNLIYVLTKLEQSFDQLVREHLCMDDITESNLIISQNNMTIIDLDRFYKDKNKSSILQCNMSLSQCIYGNIFQMISTNERIPYNIEGKDITEYINLSINKGVINTSELMFLMKLYYENITGIKLTNIEDIYKVTEMERKLIQKLNK